MLRMLLGFGSVDVWSVALYVVSSLVTVFLVLPFHEFAHAYVANRLGDPTARYQGRMTVNPFAHIDYLGALALIFFGFGWARPVPINARNFRNPKQGMALSALAGPMSNLLVAFVATFLWNGFYVLSMAHGGAVLSVLTLFFRFLVQINVGLAVFNLIPVPPLDGSRLLTAVLPDRIYFQIMRYERYIALALIVLLYTGVLTTPLNWISSHIIHAFLWVTGLIF